ncbi:MAG TPA: c-type cytochrome [Gammaproteobacteria bacterium]|nr:c-type cytochrome [Gammaproteobacteria bacterium]HIL99325.1 c-type cytochrome [Pseudomonadales bacterium]
MARILKRVKSWAMMAGIGFLLIGAPFSPTVAASPGSGLYKKACKKCHGKMGAGKKIKADPGKFKYPPINQLTREDLSKTINEYREAWRNKTYTKTEKKMAKPAGKLSDQDISALVEFIISQLSLE